MSHVLTKSEAESVKRLLRFCENKLKKESLEHQGGLIPITTSYEVQSFVESYFAAREIDANIHDAEVLGFRSVGMRTDNIYPDGIETLIIPIKGSGELNHFKQGKIKECRFNSAQKSFGKTIYPLWLDQVKPHSFITDVDCYAILTGVDKESLEKLFDFS